MKSFIEQLTVTRQNLERLEALYAKHPELFEFGSLVEVTPERVRVFIHASKALSRDWKSWASQYPANWTREPSPSSYASHWDYDGVLDGVEIAILQAERREQPEPLFQQASAA